MARLDKNFAQINATLNAFGNDPSTNKPEALQFEDTLAIATNTFSTANVSTGGAGWYRVAYINLARSGSEGSIFQSVGTIYLTGFYSAYKPTKGVFNYTYDGGGNANSIVQIAGVLSTSPTQIRLGNTSAGHSKGQGYLFVDLYFSNTNAREPFALSIIADGVRGIEMIAPTLITGTPAGETVRATLNIATIATGHVTTTA